MTPETALRAYCAAWVWDALGGLRDGVFVVCQGGLILEVASRPPAGCTVADLGEGLIMPGLVNAHTHLELSFLAGLVPPRNDFVGWLTDLVKARPGHDHGRAVDLALAAAQAARAWGTALAGDITNTGRAQNLWAQAGVSAVSFFEALGPGRVEPPEPMSLWQDGLLRASAVAAHAPYSVPDWRLQALKARAGSSVFCLHAAESRAEMEFFAGQGAEGQRLARFLEERGMDMTVIVRHADRPLAHLEALGLLDRHTLLVHGVQLNQEEVETLAASGASLCVCPRSNLGLTGGLAPIEDLLKAGVNLGLGTDSLASAPDLNLWNEMAALTRAKPGLAPEAMLTMATLGGARALGQEKRFGSLAPGAAQALIHVPLPRLKASEVLAAAASGLTTGAPCQP